MPRKQLSGAQKRKLAKARSLIVGQLMPRVPSAKEFESLTGISREHGRKYRELMAGKISPDLYLVAVKGLSEMTRSLVALEVERQRAIDERLAQSIEALEAHQTGIPTISYSLKPRGPRGGELLPRETADEVSE